MFDVLKNKHKKKYIKHSSYSSSGLKKSNAGSYSV